MSEAIAPYAKDIFGKWRSFARGPDKRGKAGSMRFDSLSGLFVDIITGKHNQDVSILWVGKKGTGKSSAALSTCYNCALKVADWYNEYGPQGSRKDLKWYDFYNLEKYTAVILDEDATRLMNIDDPYCIKNFDDIGVGWNAREWRNEENVAKNDVFQINRTDKTIQIMTVPDQFLLDKVPRSLVSHYVEMDEQLFDHGYSTIKLFKPKTMYRNNGKQIFPYLQVDRFQYVNYAITSPPKDLWEEYNKLRAKNRKIAGERASEQRGKQKEMAQLEQQFRMDRLEKREKIKKDERASRIMKHKDEKKQWIKLLENAIPAIVYEVGVVRGHKDPVKRAMTLDLIVSRVMKRQGASAKAIQYYLANKIYARYEELKTYCPKDTIPIIEEDAE